MVAIVDNTYNWDTWNVVIKIKEFTQLNVTPEDGIIRRNIYIK